MPFTVLCAKQFRLLLVFNEPRAFVHKFIVKESKKAAGN